MFVMPTCQVLPRAALAWPPAFHQLGLKRFSINLDGMRAQASIPMHVRVSPCPSPDATVALRAFCHARSYTSIDRGIDPAIYAAHSLARKATASSTSDMASRPGRTEVLRPVRFSGRRSEPRQCPPSRIAWSFSVNVNPGLTPRTRTRVRVDARPRARVSSSRRRFRYCREIFGLRMLTCRTNHVHDNSSAPRRSFPDETADRATRIQSSPRPAPDFIRQITQGAARNAAGIIDEDIHLAEGSPKPLSLFFAGKVDHNRVDIATETLS